MFRIEGASAMRIDVSLRQQIQNGVVRQWNDFIDLVGRAKTIEEMNKWHSAFQRGDMRNQREVLRFLHAAGAEHSAAGLTHGHHI